MYSCISKVQSRVVIFSFCLGFQPSIDFNNQPFNAGPKCVHLDECVVPGQLPENNKHSVGDYFIIIGCEDEGRFSWCSGHHNIQEATCLCTVDLGQVYASSCPICPNIRQGEGLDSIGCNS